MHTGIACSPEYARAECFLIRGLYFGVLRVGSYSWYRCSGARGHTWKPRRGSPRALAESLADSEWRGLWSIGTHSLSRHAAASVSLSTTLSGEKKSASKPGVACVLGSNKGRQPLFSPADRITLSAALFFVLPLLRWPTDTCHCVCAVPVLACLHTQTVR